MIDIVNTKNTLTLTANTPTNVLPNTRRTNANINTEANTVISTRPSLFLGIEKLVNFSQNQQAGENSARIYIKAIEDFEDLRDAVLRTAEEDRAPALSIEMEKTKKELIQL